MSDVNDGALVEEALKARKMAYVPYSHFSVGAALITDDGHLFTGCNIENAGYTPSNCAERTAFFKAISEGYRKFKKIAIVGGNVNQIPLGHTPPCGVCRQVMQEFCDPETFEIVLGISKEQYKSYKLKELLPLGFGPSNLKGESL